MYCATPGGTRYHDGVNKPLVARVAELEEKLVNCSMENATAKQVGVVSIGSAIERWKVMLNLRREIGVLVVMAS